MPVKSPSPKAVILVAVFVLMGALPFLLPGPSKGAPPAPAAPATKPKDAKPAGDKAAADKATPAKASEPVLENVVTVTPDELVNKPQEYMGKNVKFNANFFAFSSLALDYKPAFRSSKTHLSFLVLRPNSHIPLSELKLAMMIPKEKDPESTTLATLKDGDQLELVGKVFSAALDEPWVEVFKFKKLNAGDDKKVAAASSESEGSDKDAANKGNNKGDGKGDSKGDSKAGGEKSTTPSPAAK